MSYRSCNCRKEDISSLQASYHDLMVAFDKFLRTHSSQPSHSPQPAQPRTAQDFLSGGPLAISSGPFTCLLLTVMLACLVCLVAYPISGCHSSSSHHYALLAKVKPNLTYDANMKLQNAPINMSINFSCLT